MNKSYRRHANTKLPAELKTANLHLQAKTDERVVAPKPHTKVILAERVTYQKK
jgi:hypothetical protein